MNRDIREIVREIQGKWRLSPPHPVEKGWSGDLKFQTAGPDGEKLLLRLSPGAQVEQKRREFEMMRACEAVGVVLCSPRAFSVENGCAYSLQKWIEGQDAERAIPTMSEARQYAYGLEAGRMLKKIHSIPAPAGQMDWETRFNRKIDRKIALYEACSLKFDGAQRMIEYLNAHRGLLKGRPQCFQHGDYHVGNMMIDKGGRLVVIDFNRYDFGDPWEEFNRIVWCAQASPMFASGLVNGYFEGRPPMMFWRLLLLYISSNTLSSLPWAIPFGQKEIDTMVRQARMIMEWYENMKRVVPRWYCGEMTLQYAGGKPCRLKSPFDFGFLERYGRVFKVFDGQDSGNVCFGLKKGAECRFVKFAGAPAVEYSGSPQKAIQRLKDAGAVYQALRHPNLAQLVDEGEMGGGYGLVFEWAQGDCMGKMYPESRRRFLSLPLEDKLRIYEDVMQFHRHVAAKGYVAVDFYDGSVMYDAATKKTTICDVDFYAPSPLYNTMGRMWGSSRFMSPEEFTLGARLDERTNVFAMGALAFELFNQGARVQKNWPLSETRFETARRAVEADPSKRWPTIERMIEAWQKG